MGLYDLSGVPGFSGGGGLDKATPTKTSGFVGQLFGRVVGWSIMGVQVCWTLFVMFDRLLKIANRRSMFSLVVIAFDHFDIIIAVVCEASTELLPWYSGDNYVQIEILD